MTKIYRNGIEAPDRSRQVVGALSGRTFSVPDVDSGYPAGQLIDRDGRVLESLPRGDGLPDTRSHRLKLGVLLPAANCTVESELWDVVYRNREELAGVGLHGSVIVTPTSKFANAEELAAFRRAFEDSVLETADAAMLADPHYLIMAFSLEHFSADLDRNAALPRLVEERTGLAIATWADAVATGLRKFGARRIGLLCPFDATGLANAVGFFENLGFEVAAAAGLGCNTGTDVGHVPDDYKEKVIKEQLLGAGSVDAVVVSGTNLSSLEVAERLEPELGIPILGSNQTTLWYALRDNGIDVPLTGGSRLLQEF